MCSQIGFMVSIGRYHELYLKYFQTLNDDKVASLEFFKQKLQEKVKINTWNTK